MRDVFCNVPDNLKDRPNHWICHLVAHPIFAATITTYNIKKPTRHQ